METYRKVVTLNEDFKVEDEIHFEMKDGEPVTVIVAAVEDNKALCIFKDCLKEEHCMNEEYTNEGGYLASDMRKYLNTEVLERLPEEIASRLQQDENGDYLRLLKEEEIFGENKYKVFDDERMIRALEYEGSDCFNWYWLQNPHFSADFGYVRCDGALDGDNGASNVFGVRPAFLIV